MSAAPGPAANAAAAARMASGVARPSTIQPSGTLRAGSTRSRAAYPHGDGEARRPQRTRGGRELAALACPRRSAIVANPSKASATRSGIGIAAACSSA